MMQKKKRLFAARMNTDDDIVHTNWKRMDKPFSV